MQGVGFRAATEQRAKDLQLSGWVRNLPDGRVEILAQGEAKALQAFQVWAEQGPRFAKVANVIAQPVAVNTDFTRFDIR